MENKPKRSKALIITIIILIFVLISVYLIIKNRDSFGTKTSNTIAKIFSPLLPSLNSKNLSVLVDNPFLGPDNKCTNKAVNPPLCTVDVDSKCLNGNINPPLCTLNTSNKCANGAINSPLCTIGSNNKCLNGTMNPPLCTLNTSNKCANGAINSPLCTIGSNNKCLNRTMNPPLCTIGGDDQCFNGATNPPLCTIGGDDQCFNGATNPPLCTVDNPNENSYECSDEKDNDGDGFIDVGDSACHIDGDVSKEYVPTHDSEKENAIENEDPNTNSYECSDEKDNDGDGKRDADDPGCLADPDDIGSYNPQDDSENESLPPPGGEPTDNYAQCSDKKDNDGDGKIDELDPNCHTGGILENDYIATHDSEKESPKDEEPTIIEEENKCKLFEENPLLFTPEEKAKLAQLLRKYYIIASSLKTEVDISMIYADVDKFNLEVEEINDLTRQCYLYTYDSTGYADFKTRNPKLKLQDFALNTSPSPNTKYTGPNAKGGNPWFKPETRISYLNSKSLSVGSIPPEYPKCVGTINIGLENKSWFLKILSGGTVGGIIKEFINYDTDYLSGRDCGAKGEAGKELNAKSRFSCEYVTGKTDINDGTILYPTSCKWTGLSGVDDWQGINDDYENILNVW